MREKSKRFGETLMAGFLCTLFLFTGVAGYVDQYNYKLEAGTFEYSLAIIGVKNRTSLYFPLRGWLVYVDRYQL
jgi:hypothetical protein